MYIIIAKCFDYICICYIYDILHNIKLIYTSNKLYIQIINITGCKI